MWHPFRKRRARIAESLRAIEKQERLRPYIELQREESRELGEWAEGRLRRNHLSQLFYDVHGRGAS